MRPFLFSKNPQPVIPAPQGAIFRTLRRRDLFSISDSRLIEIHFAPPEGSGEVDEFTSRNHAC